MYDRNVKPERILTELLLLHYEYICDRTAKLQFFAGIFYISIQYPLSVQFIKKCHTAVTPSTFM